MGSRDFSGRDKPEISIPGFYWKSMGMGKSHKLYVFRWRISLLSSSIWCILPSNRCILITYGQKVANFRKWGLHRLCSPPFWKFVNMVGARCVLREEDGIFGNSREPNSLHFRIFVKTQKMNPFCGLKRVFGWYYLLNLDTKSTVCNLHPVLWNIAQLCAI